MLASLPNTVPKEKLGPRLMQYIKGEAETVCEAIAVEKLCAEDGDKLVFKLLDDRFGPQPTDLLQKALKEFFYELQVKQGEPFQQFAARFYAANLKLPDKVLGFFMMKKLRLDSTQEAMVLTATRGELKKDEIAQAIKAVFPEGKGGVSQRQRDVFYTAEDEHTGDVEDTELQDVLEALEEYQAEDQLDDESILEAFETYSEIRKKITERKKQRGFTPNDGARWRLSGTVSGGLEQLKSRTRCHLCKRYGHWKRECPTKGGGKGKASSTSSSSGTAARTVEARMAETSDVYAAEDMEARDLLQKFAIRKVTWGKDTSEDVRNSGFADSHSTGKPAPA